jgi:hypothetical protein
MSEDTLLLRGLPAASSDCLPQRATKITHAQQLERSVNTLGGLNEEVKAIDCEVESRSTKQGEIELGSR